MGRRIWRAMKLATLAVLALAGLMLAVGAGYRARRHHAIAAEAAIDPVRGIDESRFVRLGGIEQWISIRGRSRDNPVILLLHGDPGIALSVMPRNFLWSWTGDFTVVEWDRRGAGKTFGRSGPVGADVTIDRMVRDGVERAEFLREHLHKKKIVLAGVSWGSMLGVHIVKSLGCGNWSAACRSRVPVQKATRVRKLLDAPRSDLAWT